MAYPCRAPGCKKVFENDLNLYNHRAGGCKGGRLCPICGDLLGYPARQHMTENHNHHQCQLCDRRFFLQQSLQFHMERSLHRRSSHQKTRRSRRNKSRAKGTKVTPFVFPALNDFSSHRKRLASALVDRLKTTLEHVPDLDIAEVYRSGSTAKGTAIGSSSDVDIILYCNTDLSTGEFAQTTKESYLRKLQSLIDRGYFSWASNVKIRKKTDFHIGISMSFEGEHFDADIIIAKKSPSNPTAAEQAAKFREMSKDASDIREHHSSELVRFQKEKIGRLPSQAKEVIRAVKTWVQENNIPMRSYFVELVVLHKVGEMGEAVGRKELLQAVVQELSRVDTMKVISWPGDTSGRAYFRDDPPPIMVDPVNPFNNVAPSFEDARCIARKIRNAELSI